MGEKEFDLGARHILFNCGLLKHEEIVLLIFDETTSEVSNVFADLLQSEKIEFHFARVPLMTSHGQEPPDHVARIMKKSDLILCLTKFSLAHSKARKAATESGSRFLSLPYYDLALLMDPAVSVDYMSQAPFVKRMQDYFTNGISAHVSSKSGTSLTLDLQGRTGNYCPGFVLKPGEMGSPPDIEANISPIENSSNGIIVVDGSITCDEFGLLETNVVLKISDGKVIDIQSSNFRYVETLEEILGPVGSKKRVVAELGVGFNPKATLTGRMLTDEGAAGCVHFGLGSNSTVGGKNNVPFHLDFVIRDPTLRIDQKVLIEGGQFCHELQVL